MTSTVTVITMPRLQFWGIWWKPSMTHSMATGEIQLAPRGPARALCRSIPPGAVGRDEQHRKTIRGSIRPRRECADEPVTKGHRAIHQTVEHDP